MNQNRSDYMWLRLSKPVKVPQSTFITGNTAQVHNCDACEMDHESVEIVDNAFTCQLTKKKVSLNG